MPHGSPRPTAGRKPGSGPYGEATQVMRVPASRVAEVKAYLTLPRLGDELEWVGGVDLAVPLALPVFEGRVPAGFPSPAEDYAEGVLDLNQYLVKHEAATFYVRVKGDSMIGAGILNEDLLTVDRALEAQHGDIVVAVVDNALTVKQLYRRKGTLRLLPDNPAYAPIEIKEGQELVIWGVVKGVVRKLK